MLPYEILELICCFLIFLQVGTVRERGEEKHLTSCGDSGRETVAYSSQTNTIEVELREREIIDMMGPFLIKYEGMLHMLWHGSTFRIISLLWGKQPAAGYWTIPLSDDK